MIKDRVEREYRAKVLWCTVCKKDLTPEETWISEDTSDGRLFCYTCAPEDAVRVKDII